MSDQGVRATTTLSGDRDGLNSVGKALHVIDLLAEAGQAVTGSALARSAGLPKSTVFRLLAQLEQAGYVDRQGSRFVIGRRVFEVGNRTAVCRPDGLRELARPYLADLFVHPLTSVQLTVLDGDEVICVDKLMGTRSVRTAGDVGGRVPATCTAEGKAMLAFTDQELVQPVLSAPLRRLTTCSISRVDLLVDQLARVRAEGVAYDRQESAVGVLAIAAPIRRWGQVVGAIGISGPVGRFNPVSARAAVLRAAAAIGRAAAEKERAA